MAQNRIMGTAQLVQVVVSSSLAMGGNSTNSQYGNGTYSEGYSRCLMIALDIVYKCDTIRFQS